MDIGQLHVKLNTEEQSKSDHVRELSSTEISFDDNDSTEEEDTTNLNNITEEEGTTNLNNSTEVEGTTNLNNSTEVEGTTNLNNSTEMEGKTNLNNSTEMEGKTNLNNSTEMEGKTNLNNSTEVEGTTNLNNSTDEEGTINLNNSTEVEDTTANQNKSTEEEGTSNQNNSTAVCNHSTKEKCSTASQNNRTEEEDTTLLNSSREEEGTTPLNLKTEEDGTTTNLNSSTEEEDTTNINNISKEESTAINLNNCTEDEDTPTNLNSTEDEDTEEEELRVTDLANSAEDESKTITAETTSDTNDTTTKVTVDQAGEHKLKAQECPSPTCQDCDDGKSLNDTAECLPGDSCEGTELGGNLWEDGGIFATDVEIAKQYSLYHTNRSTRTLNQKVQINFIGTPMSRRIPVHTSLKPKTTDKGSTKDIGSSVNNPNLSSHLVSDTYSRQHSTTKQQTELKQTSAIRTQQCKGTLFAICTHCNHRNMALYSCEDCMVNCCSVCIYALHPRETLYKNHTILSGHTVLRCGVHDEPLSWYCRTCDQPICAMSLALSTHSSHGVEKVETYIKNEKKQLLESYRQVGTRCLEKAHVNLTALDECEESVRLEWILQKQQIQQEFATLKKVIGETEDYLIKDGQKAVDSRIRHLNSMRHAYGDVVDREARLAQMSLDSVNETTKSHFFKLVNNTQEELSNFAQQTEVIPNVSLTGMTPLATPLSLFQVTTYLKQLKLSLGSSAIRPHQRVLFVPGTAIRASITTHELWDAPDLTSSSLTYSIEIKDGWSSKGYLWKGVASPGGLLFNGPGVYFLQGNCRYMMKVTPRYRTTTGYVTYETTLGKPCRIFIITALEAMDQSPDRINTAKITASYLYTSFEEDRLAYITQLSRAEKETPDNKCRRERKSFRKLWQNR